VSATLQLYAVTAPGEHFYPRFWAPTQCNQLLMPGPHAQYACCPCTAHHVDS
jgi:hypothetical protein